jgi:hypothetical protein
VTRVIYVEGLIVYILVPVQGGKRRAVSYIRHRDCVLCVLYSSSYTTNTDASTTDTHG